MAKKGTSRTTPTTEEKLLRSIQAFFILHARQIDMSGDEIRQLLGVDKADVSAVAKVVNKALSRLEKRKK